MKEQKYTVQIESLGITLATGTLAKQANGSVTITCGDTSVFVAVTAAETSNADLGYFPLMVEYREKFAAAGRFPGGYFKREARPSEKETLTARLCDRPLRPLFPKGFVNEVQVVGFLLSADLVNEPDVLMVNGASAALMCSDIPFHGPIGCVRIGEIDGKFVVNPTNEAMFNSRLDLIYVGTERDMIMIEGSADQLPEERLIEALELAQAQIQPILQAQRDLAALVKKEKRAFELLTLEPKVLEICQEAIGSKMGSALYIKEKRARADAISALKEEAKEKVLAAVGPEAFSATQLGMAFDQIQEATMRNNMLKDERRLDGRTTTELRDIECQVNIMARTHGSSFFQRGETQAIVSATLGTSRDAQDLDALTGGPQSKSFFLHYNFPPYSVGETGRFGTVSRREIGHGALAERSLLPVIPAEDAFPYAIRLVSEIMESNGSSSMASVCGGCLALMDAGVPILETVAGISIGMVSTWDAKEENITDYKLLTDILGSEDHFGDMDFKVAGTKNGITGFQLDLKVKGLPFAIAKQAIFQSKEARQSILETMERTLPMYRKELKEHAPRVHRMMIDPEKIGALIGPGGKNIKRITEVTGAQIDINEDNSGAISIYATTGEALEKAIEEVNLITAEIEVGKTYRGIVRGIKEFGAFVECLPGKEGLVHISELSDVRVNDVEDVCKLGDEIVVKCIDIDEKGRVRLSRKAALQSQKVQVS